MARIKIPFKGVTSNPNHEDGECMNIVNLRPKNGSWKPVPPRKVLQNLSNEYDIVFVHRGNNYEKWIGVINEDNTSSVYCNILGDAHELITQIDESINSIQQIGNTLSLITDQSIHYLIYNGGYKYLGEIPETINVAFSTPSMTTSSIKYKDEFGSPPPRTDGTQDQLFEYTKALATLIVANNNQKFSDAFLIRYAYRLYDGSLIRHSSPILIMPSEYYKEWGTAYLPVNNPSDTSFGSDSEVRIKLFTLSASYDFSSLSEWKDIIKSVDFFVTKYVGLASPENVKWNFWLVGDGNGVSRIYYPNFRTIGEQSDSSPDEKVINTSQFYLYYSEDDFTGQKSVTFPTNKSTVKFDFQNIIYQELMKDDPMSHHRLGAKNASVYNQRLRLSIIRTTMFGGFPVNHFEWLSKYNGTNTPDIINKDIYAIVYIKTSDGEKITKSLGRVQRIFLSSFISYPDSRAYKIDFVTKNVGMPYEVSLVYSINLHPHPMLNMAYYLNADLKPITFSSYSETLPAFIPPSSPNEYNSIVEKNKLKISEVDNPFAFPNETTYLIGSGEILNEATLVMNVSDRNYGMYPMFVFTTDGVFTMAGQTDETVHSSIQSPTYIEPPTSPVVCATPYGVVFATRRGLMIINQYKTEFLSPQLRESPDSIHIDLSVGNSTLPSYPSESFYEYLSGVNNIIYNPYNDEIIISNKGKPYNYVFDLETKTFYISTEKIDVVVQNCYPDIYVIGDGMLKDYSNYGGEEVDISIVTRPTLFGTTDIKKLERIFLRALMYNANNVRVVAYHSLDGVHFDPVKGFTFGSGENYKDFDLGLLARETYRQYIFMITGTINDESIIDCVEFEVEKRYANDKMR